MKGINIFKSDKIRIHPLEFTMDRLGMATGPYYLLDLTLDDEALEQTINEALVYSKDKVPHRAISPEEEKMYFQKLGVKSHKDLGHGVDITLDKDLYTITPFDDKGLFGNPIEADASSLLDTVKGCLNLSLEKVV